MELKPSFSGGSPQPSSRSLRDPQCVNTPQQSRGAGVRGERDMSSLRDATTACAYLQIKAFPPLRPTEAVEKAISSPLGLPALRIGAHLLKTIRANLVTVVTGSTGCGKTTIVPLLLLLQYTNARLLIALPRRIAVQMAAERLRQLLGEECLAEVGQRYIASARRVPSIRHVSILCSSGKTVGYHLGHEDPCRSSDTRLLFVTAGMLRKYTTGALRKLHVLGQTDIGSSSSNTSGGPLPQDRLCSIFPYDFVLVDEVHERSVDCDMALLLLKCLAVKLTTAAAREVQLPLFRIVVMSATISANDFATFLSGESLNLFEAEHAAWTDQTRLLRLRGDLQKAQLSTSGFLPVTTPCNERQSEAEMQRSALRQRSSLLSWAKNLSVSLNELTRLWKSRRSKDLLGVLREQQSSLASDGRSKKLPWIRISDSASVRGNCVEVARQTCFPVEELFWEDLRDLAAAPFTCSSLQLLEVASPALLRFMGIGPIDDEPFARGASYGLQSEAVGERKSLFGYAATSPSSSFAQGEEGSVHWDDTGLQDVNADEYSLDAPKLMQRDLEEAARLILLIYTQCLKRNVPQRGVLVFLPGKPEILRMARALAEAKRQAMITLRSSQASSNHDTGTGSSAQPTVDLQILQIHRDAETEDLGRAKKQMQSSTCMKIILATNIAESSITFADVSIVVDFALVKEKHVHSLTKAHRLQLCWASRAALQQRKGRAGRVGEGVYMCLIPRELYESLAGLPLPELQRLPLEDVLMDTMAALPGESSDASLFFVSQAQDPPDVRKAHEALCDMEATGALELRSLSSPFTRMTPLGHLACSLALPVKVTRLLLLGAAYAIMEAAVWAAALLTSERTNIYESQRHASNPQDCCPSDCEFFWGEFIPCDICVDVLTMLRLHNQFGDSLRRLHAYLHMRGAGYRGRQSSRSHEMEHLRRHLLDNGLSLHAVADTVTEYYAILRKLTHAGFSQRPEATRATPVFLSGVNIQEKLVTAVDFQNKFEGFVWRLQLVLASAYMPFSFSTATDDSMRAPFNLGHQLPTHFAYNVLCYDAFRERPDLRCGKAVLESWKQDLSSSPLTRFQVSTAGKSTSCICSYRFCEGGSEVPALHQGHLESLAARDLEKNSELNEERWSQLELAKELQLLLRNGCSLAFRLQLGAALLRASDPECFFSSSSQVHAMAWFVVKRSLGSWMAERIRMHATLVSDFQMLLQECEARGVLKDLHLGDWHGFRPVKHASRVDACARATRNDTSASSRGSGACNTTNWIGVSRALDLFITKAVLHLADSRPTQLLAQALCNVLVQMPECIEPLYNEQRVSWLMQPQVDRIRSMRQRLTQRVMQLPIIRRLASCLKPLQFFSLTVKKSIPLSDLLLCEGWDFDFRSAPWDISGLQQRLEDLLFPLLSGGSRALLPLDIRGVAEAVREYFSSRQVEARQQQAQGNSKRAKGQGRIRYVREQEDAQVNPASAWPSVVDTHIDSLQAAVDSVTEPGNNTSKLLEEAAATTQVISAYWRRRTPLHGQAKVERAQLLFLGDRRRKALLQWLHRAARAVDMGGSGRKQGKLTWPELEFSRQPVWTSTLPLGKNEYQVRAPQSGGRDQRAPSTSSPSADDEAQYEEMLLEAAESAQRIAGGANADEEQILGLVPQATRAVSKLLELQAADFECVERFLKASEEERESRALAAQFAPTSSRAEEVSTGSSAYTLKGSATSEAPSQHNKCIRWEAKHHQYMPRVKTEADPLAQRPSLRSSQDGAGRRGFLARDHGRGAPQKFARHEDVSNEEAEGCALQNKTFFSVAHRFLKEFLDLDAEARSTARLRGQPDTARISRFAEDSILHSNGPFYPRSSTRDFLVLSLNEWDVSSGRGSAVGAASLLPPLPHLEELLLFLLAPATVMFVANRCLCYCCKSCPCNPQRGPKADGCDCGGGQSAGSGITSTSCSQAASRTCCASCLRDAVCYASVSFGGFRDFGFVPRFLWKDKDIALLNEARSALAEVFKPRVGSVKRSSPSSARAQRGTNRDKRESDHRSTWASEEDEADESDESEGSGKAEEIDASLNAAETQTTSAGSRLDSLLEQLVLPKLKMQSQQRVAATAASAQLRSRKKPQEVCSEDNSDHPLLSSKRETPICWTCLDLAKRPNILRHSEERDGHAFPFSIALYNMEGAPLPERAGALAADILTNSFHAPPEPPPPSTVCERPARMAGEGGETGVAPPQSHEGLNCTQRVDSLATAITTSLQHHQAPEASKTALLPDGARPSMWGLPASFLLGKSSSQDPPLPELQNSEKWQKAARQRQRSLVDNLLIQCSNSCCRMPVGFVGDLERVSADKRPSEGARRTIIGLKYLLEELGDHRCMAGEAAGGQRSASSSGSTDTGRAHPPRADTICSSSTLEQTLLKWMVETELVDSSVAEKVKVGTRDLRRQTLWVLDVEKVRKRSLTECGACSQRARTTEGSNSGCNKWSCMLRQRVGRHRVQLLDDEKATLAKLKLEGNLLLTPANVAFVFTYMQPLLRTRRRLQGLFRAKQEQTFRPDGSPELIAQQNRIKQEHSYLVDKFVGWVLCGGPVRHIIGFHIFDYVVFTSDSLIDIAGHTDAQKVYFWKLVSSGVIPRAPNQFVQQPVDAPILSFQEALAVGECEGGVEGRKMGGTTTSDEHEIFWEAAKYIHRYEQGVRADDLKTSSAFVEHLKGLIAKRCWRKEEKSDIKGLVNHEKHLLESWSLNRGVPEDNSVAFSRQQRQGGNSTQAFLLEESELSGWMRDVQTPTSAHLEASLMPSDLFEWQQHLLKRQRLMILKESSAAAHKQLPAGWADSAQTRGREIELQSFVWRWAADKEDLEQQRRAQQEAQRKRDAEEAERRAKEEEARREMLLEKARKMWEDNPSSFPDLL
ncbi:hypothetical protein Emed_001030 [Eimeria media]